MGIKEQVGGRRWVLLQPVLQGWEEVVKESNKNRVGRPFKTVP